MSKACAVNLVNYFVRKKCPQIGMYINSWVIVNAFVGQSPETRNIGRLGIKSGQEACR